MEKPSPEAKALSLFLMTFKATDPACKTKSIHMNRLWDLVKAGKMRQTKYNGEVQNTLTLFGGYSEVVEKTVKFYIKKTGVWKVQGNDKFSVDSKKVAEKIFNKK